MLLCALQMTHHGLWQGFTPGGAHGAIFEALYRQILQLKVVQAITISETTWCGR